MGCVAGRQSVPYFLRAGPERTGCPGCRGERVRRADEVEEPSDHMAEKSPRRRMLEQSLAESPDDAFLRYGLAMQCLRDGDVEEGRQRLRSLIADDPDRQVAAYQQLGQSFVDTDEPEAAMTVLGEGVARARAAGDGHAAAEMEYLIESLRS
jgi:thioredoxin-like negative regulator of GroEL